MVCLQHRLSLALLGTSPTGWVALIVKRPLCTPQEFGAYILQSSGSLPGDDFGPRECLEMAEDSFGCHNWGWGRIRFLLLLQQITPNLVAWSNTDLLS